MEGPVWRVDVASGQVTRLTGNGHAGNVVPLRDGGAIFTQNSIMAPDDLFRVDRGRHGHAADRRQSRAAGAARPGELREIRLQAAPTTTACGASS